MSALGELNVGTPDAPRRLSIAKDTPTAEMATMIDLLHKYKDVFAWSHEDMKRLDPKFYQHQINLVMVANPYNKGVTA